MPANVTISTHPLEDVLLEKLLGVYSAWYSTGYSANSLSTNINPGYNQAVRTQLWICPSMAAARHYQNLFMHRHQKEVVSPWFMTFDEFASKLLTSSDQNVFHLAPFEQTLLIREVVEQLQRDQKIPKLENLISNSSFVSYILRYITEMKRDEIWPEMLIELLNNKSSNESYRDLVTIYDSYQHELITSEHYDAQGRFWSARELLANGHRGPFLQLKRMVIHGFNDFTASQKSIIANLSSWLEDIQISLTLETPLKRLLLFSKSQSTLSSLDSVLKQSKAKIQISHLDNSENSSPVNSHPDSLVSAGLGQLRNNLFALPNQFTPMNHAQGIKVYAVSGYQAEAHYAIARIKELLLNNIPAEEILVVFRQLGEKSLLFAQLGLEAGVPVSYDHYYPLMQTPVAKSLKKLIELELNDWSFTSIYQFANSRVFYPECHPAESPEQLLISKIRELNLTGGRIEIIEALTRHIEYEKTKCVSDQAGLWTDSLKNFIGFLNEKLSPLRDKHTFESWVEILINQFQSFWKKDTHPERDQKDQQHWDQIVGVLKESVRLQRRLTHDIRELHLREFNLRLDELLQTLISGEFLPSRTPGTVRVLSADDARHLNVDFTFILDLTQDQFAARSRQEWEDLKSQLNSYTKRPLNELLSEEQLLFYNITAHTRKELYLSYPATNSSGEPLSPSPCVVSLMTLFTAKANLVSSLGNLDPVQNTSLQLTATDRRLFATQQLSEDSPGYFQTLCRDPQSCTTARNQFATIETLKQRLHTNGLTSFEGEISESPAVREHLQKMFPEYHQYSATQLEGYLSCYYRFMVEQIMGVTEINEPGINSGKQRQGTIMHDVFAYNHQNQQNEMPASLAERLKEFLSIRLKKEIAWNDMQHALIEIEKRILSRWCEHHEKNDLNYQELMQNFAVLPQTSFSELAFGSAVPQDQENLTSQENRYPPVTFGENDRKVLLRGRIDRIDHGVLESQQAFNIVDYKSGSYSTFDKNLRSKSGYQLQLAMYTIAAVRLGIIPHIDNVYQLGYWKIKGNGFTSGKAYDKTKKKLDQEFLESITKGLDRLLPMVVDSIKAGHFPVFNRNKDCTNFCSFKTICRINEVRSRSDSLNKYYDIEPFSDHTDDDSEEDATS